MTSPSGHPAYHLAPPANWLSDPNGLVWHDGVWHLFYQYNPHGEEWGHMSWGHATSLDLVRWTHRPPAILYDDRHHIFSGCALVDHDGRAGFGAGAIVAAYTAATPAGEHQAQHLASSLDGGLSFAKYAGNPVLDLGLADFRDPNILFHDPSGEWIMVVAMAERSHAALFGSRDLKSWRHLSDIGPWGAPGRVWECPMLVELPIEGGGTRWLFKVDVLHGGPGSGAIAVSGRFDGRCFIPDRDEGEVDWQVIDHGRDFYAAVPWHEPRDAAARPCWIAWVGNHGYQGQLPRRGWRGMMSLPRRLSLARARGRFRLVQAVEPAIAEAFEPSPRVIEPGVAIDLPMAMQLVLAVDDDTRATLRFRQVNGDSLTIAFAGGRVQVDRRAGFDDQFDQPVEALVTPGPLTIWIDAGVVEIEADGGQQWLTLHHRLFDDRMTLTLDGDAAMPVDVGEFISA